MGHEISSYLGINEIENPSSMIIFIIISYLFNRTFYDLSVRVFMIYLFRFFRIYLLGFLDLFVRILFWCL